MVERTLVVEQSRDPRSSALGGVELRPGEHGADLEADVRQRVLPLGRAVDGAHHDLHGRPGRPALFVRKQAKEYGTCKLAEGPEVAGRRVTLVEDVITTGGAVRDATRALRDAGAIVEVVVCAIDRSPADQNPLADVGLEVRSVLTKAELDAVRA